MGRVGWRRGLGLAALAIGLALFSAVNSRAETRFGPAYSDRALLGPGASQGAVIWNHGTSTYYGAADSSKSVVPIFVDLLRDAGWDVYRLDRPPQGEAPDTSSAALLAAIAQLKAERYRKIVLTGQSAGAWISLIAAGQTTDLYAVIVNAPAYYGVDRPRFLLNASALYDYLGAIRGGRIMLSYFRDDPFDPGGRGERSEEILARNGIPHLVLDRPEGFSGHGAGSSGLFYRRFGACVLAMVADGPVPRREACETRWGEAPSGEVPLPKDLAFMTPAHGPAADFIGRWWGTYAVGRELELAVTRSEGERVEAVYAVGPMPGKGGEKGGFTTRIGRLAGDTLEFVEPGKPTLRYRPAAGGRLEAEWIAANGRYRLTALLRRLPR